MKNFLILFFMLWLLSGCKTRQERIEFNNQNYPEFVFQKIDLGNSVYRLENAEVICYYSYEASIECKFKGKR